MGQDVSVGFWPKSLTVTSLPPNPVVSISRRSNRRVSFLPGHVTLLHLGKVGFVWILILFPQSRNICAIGRHATKLIILDSARVGDCI